MISPISDSTTSISSKRSSPLEKQRDCLQSVIKSLDMLLENLTNQETNENELESKAAGTSKS